MPTTFCIYGKKDSFTSALLSAFSLVGNAVQVSTVTELHAHPAAIVITVSNFHDHIAVVGGTVQLHVKTFETVDSFPSHPFTYYVHQNAKISDAANAIVKRFCGFNSKLPCIITPHPEYVKSTIETIRVDTQPVVITSTPIAESYPVTPVPAVPRHEPSVSVPPARAVAQPKAIPPRTRIRRFPKVTARSRKVIEATMIFGIWLLSLPYVLLLVSGSCMALAVKTMPSVSSTLTTPLLQCAQVSASTGTTVSAAFTSVPLIGTIAKTPLSLSSFVYESAILGQEGHAIIKELKTHPEVNTLEALAPRFEKLSRDISFLSSKSQQISVIKRFAPQLETVFAHASYLPILAAVSHQAPELFGNKGPVTYMVLLQNNMELRPTGGFIGSFLLVDIDNGEVAAQNIYDVYDADGQLAGYVKPPTPIRNYLGEAKWTMRDSNWDPDFATSAERAAWFLDKSLNREVHGVIGVNLEVLRTIIATVGPITVPDYGGTLTAETFYQKIQSEVHKEFFPGSRKKSNYLTAVFNAVLHKLQSEGEHRALSLLSGLLRNIEARDIQLYSRNTSVQAELLKANVAGVMPGNAIGFVEANVGVNKANQFIERAGELSIQKTDESITATSVIKITNKASSVSDETRYRVYARGIAPKGSTVSAMNVSLGGEETAVIPELETVDDREEAGALATIEAGQTGVITITWEIPSTSALILWKQGGVEEYPISVSALTKNGDRQYNTSFGKDIVIPL